jgi:protein-tyrosine phosphatase
MIDLHAHILPGLDDGPESDESALAMARGAVAAGTRTVATTCHINHLFGLGAEQLASARAKLTERLEREGVALELIAGGEVAPERLPDLDDDELNGLTLGGGPYVLLECPFAPVGATMDRMVADLQGRGFGVLLAHPERSPTFQHDPARLAALVDRGALAQVTTGSFTGTFGGTAQRTANAMLEQGIVHVLSSDAHDSERRPPDLRAAGLDGAQVEWMAQAAPAAVVAGRALPERPPLPRPRGMRARLRSWSAR